MEGNIAVVEWSLGLARAYNPATRQTATAPTLAEALTKVGAAGPVGLCLGRRVSFVRETHVPAVDKSELRLIVNVQLESLFPAVRTELAFDYDLGTQRYDDGVQATVCAVPADNLRLAIGQVVAAGASVAWTAPTALGAIHVARLAGHDDAIVVEEEGGFLHLDIVRHGMLVYSRSAVAPASREERQAEVSRTLASYGLPSAAVIAVGETDLGTDVRTAKEGTLEAMSAHDKAEINIELPEAIVGKIKRASAAKSRLALFLWLAVLCVAGLAYIDREEAARAAAEIESKRDREVKGLDTTVGLYTTELERLNSTSESLDLAFQPAQTVGDVLTLVSNSAPSEIWLSGITFERGKPLQVRGVALSGEAVSAYVSALALETRFRDVQLVFANNSEIDGRPVVQFAITAHVVGNLPLDEDRGTRR